MSLFILPYKSGSASARDLAVAMGARRIKRRNSRYRYRVHHRVINWGCSDTDYAFPMLNSPRSVGLAANKLQTFNRLSAASLTCIPDYTTNKEQAMLWAESGTVVCRTLLTANSGRGIVLARSPSEVVNAPLYTKYIPKKHEYRVHVMRGLGVVDVQRKMRSSSVPDDQVNWQVRNHTNGFIFGREGVTIPDCAKDIACDVLQELGLDFAAVDLIWNEHRDAYTVLEVNTAPGLTGTTLEIYSEKLLTLLGE